MSHEFSHKKAIILGYRNYGEKDRYYNFLIEDEGFRYVRVQGVRDIKSKHRNLLSLFTCPLITYMNNREYRLIGIKEDEYLATTQAQVFFFVLLAHMLRVIDMDDTEHMALYSVVRTMYTEVTNSNAQNFQIALFTLENILNYVGYGEEKDSYVPLEQVIIEDKEIHSRVRAMVYGNVELQFLNEYLEHI